MLQTGSENNGAKIYPESGNEVKQTFISAVHQEDQIYPELNNLLHISRFKKHEHLLKHPFIKSFVMLKWHNMQGFYWFTVFFYTLYLSICTSFIILLHSADTHGWDDIELEVYFSSLKNNTYYKDTKIMKI